MRAFLIIVAVSALFVGCDSKQTWPPSPSAVKKIESDYDAALADARSSIPYAADFARLFPESLDYFSYYIGGVGRSSLNMETLLFDRYQLTMGVPVTFDASRRKVKSFGKPEFVLLEYSEVKKIRRSGRGPDGSPSVSENLQLGKSGDRSLRFGAGEWMKVVEAHGDCSVIGFEIITNLPAAGFEYLRKDWELRKDWHWGMQMQKQP
jgi:hypothetical protein